MRSRTLLILSISALSIFLCSDVQAASIAIFNTGVDGSNVVLSDGAIDPHYTITSSPSSTYGPAAYAATNGVYPVGGGAWFPNTSVSKWISPEVNTNQSLAVGNYTYSTTFDLTGLDPTTAIISGNWTTDNLGVDILINGASTGNTINNSYSFQSFHAFAITSGFVSGINTLDFILKNEGGPTGLRVEVAGTANSASTSVPEPGTMLLLGSGLVGLVGYGRRRIKK